MRPAHRSFRLHKLLGLEFDAAYARVKRGYQHKVRQCHPDVNQGRGDEFLSIQAAWEEYRKFRTMHETNSSSQAASIWPAARKNELQCVLLSLTIHGSRMPLWNNDSPQAASDHVHRLRSAVTRSISGMCARDELPAVDVRRIELVPAESREDEYCAHVHVLAEQPSHRDAVVRMCTASPKAFSQTLGGALKEVGWSTSALPVGLRVCLPYSIVEPSPPAPPPCSPRASQRSIGDSVGVEI